MSSARDLPRRLAASVGGSIDAAGDLPEFQRELMQHLRSMDEGIRLLSEQMASLQGEIGAVSARAQALERYSASMDAAMTRTEDHVAHIDEQIPDPDAPSPIAKAKEALLGGDGDPPSAA